MIVLDASAVLCVLYGEPGMERVLADGKGAFISSVNLCEVLSKAIDDGVSREDRDDIGSFLALRVVPFDQDAAQSAADLRSETRSKGLSLGDRACLALARTLGATALTTDRKWSDLTLNIAVQQLR